MKPLYALLLAAPLALAGRSLGWDPLLMTMLTATALVPLSEIIADAGEDLAVHAGPRVGGVVASTTGNLAVMLLAVVAMYGDLLRLVKASITGAILSNLLLVLGLSLFVGGLRHGRQYFNREQASMSATLMVLTVIALIMPAVYWALVPNPDPALRNAGDVEALSLAVAATMLTVYVLSLYFSLFWEREQRVVAAVHHTEARWTVRVALPVLLLAVAGFIVIAMLFVGAVPATTERWPISDYFIGIVVVPIIANASAHGVAVESAFRNRADLSVSVAMGSSIHVALFVAPSLVFLSLWIGHPMDLIFSQLELVALAATCGVATLVAHDGMSNWLEGAMLVAVYAILALAFFWVPL